MLLGDVTVGIFVVKHLGSNWVLICPVWVKVLPRVPVMGKMLWHIVETLWLLVVVCRLSASGRNGSVMRTRCQRARQSALGVPTRQPPVKRRKGTKRRKQHFHIRFKVAEGNENIYNWGSGSPVAGSRGACTWRSSVLQPPGCAMEKLNQFAHK